MGFAINAAETRQAVFADRVTELELRLPGTDTLVNAVAALAGEPVRYLELAPAGDGRTEVLFALADADVEAVLELQAEFVGVEALDHVGDERTAGWARCQRHGAVTRQTGYPLRRAWTPRHSRFP